MWILYYDCVITWYKVNRLIKDDSTYMLPFFLLRFLIEIQHGIGVEGWYVSCWSLCFSICFYLIIFLFSICDCLSTFESVISSILFFFFLNLCLVSQMVANTTNTIYSDHPLFLHPSNTTRLSLVSVQLTWSENYFIWSIGMYVALLQRTNPILSTTPIKRKILILCCITSGIVVMPSFSHGLWTQSPEIH